MQQAAPFDLFTTPVFAGLPFISVVVIVAAIAAYGGMLFDFYKYGEVVGRSGRPIFFKKEGGSNLATLAAMSLPSLALIAFAMYVAFGH